MIRLYALVAAGGAVGSMARYWLAGVMLRATGPGFPWGTVLINTLGSLAIGWLAGLVVHSRATPHLQLQAFAMVGLCGGFTTFSSFSLQTLDLLRAGRNLEAGANVIGSVMLCLAAAAVGLSLGK